MSNQCFMLKAPKEPRVDVIYIYVARKPGYDDMAKRFAASFVAFPPNYPHLGVTIMCNGGQPSNQLREMFGTLPNCRLKPHDNSGKDIGAWISESKSSTADVCVYMGSSVHFWRAGWLRRMMDAWITHGPGIYGMSASYSLTPHFNTTGFWCAPSLLASYPHEVRTDEDRYNFEHGRHPRPDRRERVFWKIAYKLGYPAMLVTWDGEYHWWDWRTPQNIYARGDQSNMLAFWNHSDEYAVADPGRKRRTEHGNDSLTDPAFDRKNRTYKI